jgi:hypothetical protein
METIFIIKLHEWCPEENNGVLSREQNARCKFSRKQLSTAARVLFLHWLRAFGNKNWLPKSTRFRFQRSVVRFNCVREREHSVPALVRFQRSVVRFNCVREREQSVPALVYLTCTDSSNVLKPLRIPVSGEESNMNYFVVTLPRRWVSKHGTDNFPLSCHVFTLL